MSDFDLSVDSIKRLKTEKCSVIKSKNEILENYSFTSNFHIWL